MIIFHRQHLLLITYQTLQMMLSRDGYSRYKHKQHAYHATTAKPKETQPGMGLASL